MSFTHIDVPQRSPEWFAARVGRLTGSAASDMLAFVQKGESAKRRDLRTRLVVERLTGQPQEDGYVSKDMQRGIDKEADAVAAYEALTGTGVLFSGFLKHDTHMAGCSLDGHVEGFAGLLELKCPKSATHFSYLKAKAVPSDYMPQITHNLWITGAQWCDFVSFDDRLPEHMQVFRVRVERNEFEILAYEKVALKFLEEVGAAYDEAMNLAAVAI